MQLLFVLFGTALAAEVDLLGFPADCPNITVIHDVVGDQWYDGCLGLTKKPETTATACEAQCKSDMTCSIWQMTNKMCWSGSVVHGCRSRGSDTALGNFEEDLVAGQRIQHGFVKLVSTNTKVETKGLKHYPEKTGDEATQIARCKEFCYTDVTCSIWQFGADGCWLEHTPGNAKGETVANSTWSQNMIAGETIEHTCPPYVEPAGLPWPWIIAGIVLGLLALGAIIYALQKKPKVKKTRAVKIEPKPEPTPVYFVPQPTILIPQQSVVMQQTAPLITTPTYSTPMTSYAQPQYTSVLR